jgi:hypothetical protein
MAARTIGEKFDEVRSMTQRVVSLTANILGLAGAPAGAVALVSLTPNVMTLNKEVVRAKGLLKFCETVKVPDSCNPVVSLIYATAIADLKSRIQAMKKRYSKKRVKTLLKNGKAALQNVINQIRGASAEETQRLLDSFNDEGEDDKYLEGFEDDDDDTEEADDEEEAAIGDALWEGFAGPGTGSPMSVVRESRFVSRLSSASTPSPVSFSDDSYRAATSKPLLQRVRDFGKTLGKTGKDTGSFVFQQIEFALDVKTAIADLQIDMNRVSTLLGQLSYVNSVAPAKDCKEFTWTGVPTGDGPSGLGGRRVLSTPIETRFKRRK